MSITAITVTNNVSRDEAIVRISRELQRQNDRLQLLLNLTTRITSSLDLREVLRAIAANIREVMHADAVAVSLPSCTDAATGKLSLQRRAAGYAKRRRQKSNGHLETDSP
jgi:uncharacterized protein YigA (DUF484 family)